MSYDEINILWRNKSTRTQIETRLRNGGYKHEWYMIAETPKFRSWGVCAQDIKRFTTRTKDLIWTHPVTGVLGGHWSKVGSGHFHRELRDVIKNSKNHREFRRNLDTFAERWKIDPVLPPMPSFRN